MQNTPFSTPRVTAHDGASTQQLKQCRQPVGW